MVTLTGGVSTEEEAAPPLQGTIAVDEPADVPPPDSNPVQSCQLPLGSPSGPTSSKISTATPSMHAQSPSAIAAAVNPTGSTINCGNIVDAVIARLRGTNPKATAPNKQDGTFTQIEKRFSTTIKWNQTIQGAFNQVKAGGDGTIAIIGVQYSDGVHSHVITMVNYKGTVGIVEGQNWGKGNPAGFITDPAVANARYNSDGKSNIGVGIVPK